MTPEQNAALAAAAVALTQRIADLQKAIQDRAPAATMEQQLGQARGLHDALNDVIAKAEGIDPRVKDACRKLGEMLDGLERTMRADDAE